MLLTTTNKDTLLSRYVFLIGPLVSNMSLCYCREVYGTVLYPTGKCLLQDTTKVTVYILVGIRKESLIHTYMTLST